MDLDKARPLVRARATGSCEACGQVTDQLDVHHRQARGAGGVSGDAADVANDPRNLLALDRACHDRTEAADEWEETVAKGLRVLHAYPHDPRGVPALLSTPQGRGWWLLTGDLGYVAVDWPASYRMTAQDLHDRSWLGALHAELPDTVIT